MTNPPFISPLNRKPLIATQDFPVEVYSITVFYEDTDALGITYHGSYIRFLDRARYTYWKKNIHLIVKGSKESDWVSAAGLVLPNIYSLEIKYFRKTKLNDDLLISTIYHPITAYRSLWDQRIQNVNDEQIVTAAQVEVVFTDTQGNLIPLPDAEYLKNQQKKHP